MRYEVIINLKCGQVKSYINNIKKLEGLEKKYFSDYTSIVITRLHKKEECKALVKYRPANKCWSNINK